MWALPSNPPHVLMPSEPELRDIKEPTGRWRSMDCPLCRGAGQFIGWAPGSLCQTCTKEAHGVAEHRFYDHEVPTCDDCARRRNVPVRYPEGLASCSGRCTQPSST